ncbi:MAG: hypothetical protein BWY85_00455 [Firmicutes bacterium ADurb.Bin506]|nr:MAG: hypothetical protein BWY85_00455 [Firmicutes bacterium ADurb.Bin506]
MKADVHIQKDDEKGVWYVEAERRTIGPLYQRKVADEIATTLKRVLNGEKECKLRLAAHEAFEEQLRLAAIEREKERERQREARELAEEQRQEKLRERILRALMLSDIDPMDFDAIVYAHDARGYGRSQDWRVAIYADEHVELLDEDSGGYSRGYGGTAKGPAIAAAKEEHEERVISIAQDFESARLERKGSKPDREYDIKWQVYECGARKYRWHSKTKGRVRHMYLKDVDLNHGLKYQKGDKAYYSYRVEDGTVGPARFDTEQEAIEWRDKNDEYGIVDKIKIPIRKGAVA